MEYTEPTWRGLDMRQLKVDEAFLWLQSLIDGKVHLYQRSDECDKCPFSRFHVLQSRQMTPVPVKVTHPLHFAVFQKDMGLYAFDNETALCHANATNLQEFGVYNFTIHPESCHLATDKQGVNVYLSLLVVAIIIYCIMPLTRGVLLLTQYIKYHSPLRRAAVTESNESNESTNSPESTESINNHEQLRRQRIVSLDAFRGMSIALMIFVNSGGGHYWWIEHATWNGLHLADLVFPSFLWIMGVCLPLSLRSQLQRLATRRALIWRISKRSFKLFFFGVCLNSINGPNLEQLRIMGVLQRFAVAYFVCGCIYVTLICQDEYTAQLDWKRHIPDIYVMRKVLVVMFLLILVHLVVIFAWPAPNCPRGYLGPGGMHDNAAYPNCTGGIIGYIDRKLLGEEHLYQHSTSKFVYDGQQPFDPEGIFGCILTIVQVLFGVHLGIIIQLLPDWSDRIKRYLCMSNVLLAFALILTNCQQENGLIPLNKNLWSLSYVFVTTYICSIVFGILVLMIDVKKRWSANILTAAGMNAIILYIGHTITHKMLPWHWRFGIMNTHFKLLLESVWNTGVWLVIANQLHHNHIYYNV